MSSELKIMIYKNNNLIINTYEHFSSPLIYYPWEKTSELSFVILLVEIKAYNVYNL